MKRLIFFFFVVKNCLLIRGCSFGEIKVHPICSGNETTLDRVYYEGYLEICYSSGREHPVQWISVCGEEWTNLGATIACNQLGYPNTTAIATTRNLSPTYPKPTSGTEINCESATQSLLINCQSSLTFCNMYGGVICSSLPLCAKAICTNSSNCYPSSTCYNCTVSQPHNCICYSECSPPCLNGGSCGYNNTCTCTSYWNGPQCEHEVPSASQATLGDDINQCTTQDCHNGGTCGSDGNCTCLDYWTGPFCEQVLCSQGECINGGVCPNPNESCICLEGYSGLQCEIKHASSTSIDPTKDTTIPANDVISRKSDLLTLYIAVSGSVLLGMVVVLITTILIVLRKKSGKKRIITSRKFSEQSIIIGEEDGTANSTGITNHNVNETSTEEAPAETSSVPENNFLEITTALPDTEFTTEPNCKANTSPSMSAHKEHVTIEHSNDIAGESIKQRKEEKTMEDYAILDENPYDRLLPMCSSPKWRYNRASRHHATDTEFWQQGQPSLCITGSSCNNEDLPTPQTSYEEDNIYDEIEPMNSRTTVVNKGNDTKTKSLTKPNNQLSIECDQRLPSLLASSRDNTHQNRISGSSPLDCGSSPLDCGSTTLETKRTDPSNINPYDLTQHNSHHPDNLTSLACKPNSTQEDEADCGATPITETYDKLNHGLYDKLYLARKGHTPSNVLFHSSSIKNETLSQNNYMDMPHMAVDWKPPDCCPAYGSKNTRNTDSEVPKYPMKENDKDSKDQYYCQKDATKLHHFPYSRRTPEGEEEEMYLPMAPITVPTISSNEPSPTTSVNENAATNHYSEILNQSWSHPNKVRRPRRSQNIIYSEEVQETPTYYSCTTTQKSQIPQYIEDHTYDEPVKITQKDGSSELDEYIYATCEEKPTVLNPPPQNGYQNQNFNKHLPKAKNVHMYNDLMKEAASKFSASVDFDDIIYKKSSKK